MLTESDAREQRLLGALQDWAYQEICDCAERAFHTTKPSFVVKLDGADVSIEHQTILLENLPSAEAAAWHFVQTVGMGRLVPTNRKVCAVVWRCKPEISPDLTYRGAWRIYGRLSFVDAACVDLGKALAEPTVKDC